MSVRSGRDLVVAWMRRRRATASTRIGRRGAALLVLAIMHLLLGVSYFLSSSRSGVVRESYAFPLLLSGGSMAFWAGIFVTVGLVSAVPAFWSAGRDAWGFSIQVAFTSVWAMFGFLGALVGGQRSWVIGLTFAAFAGLILIISGMRGVNDDVA